MKIIGIAGWSGSGKTTLLTRLLPDLVGRGLRVSTVKHAHMHFDADRPGKDSYRHREAGATEVAVISPHRWALMHENRGEPEATLEEIVRRMSPVDLLVVEGFKMHDHDKIEVYRRELGKPLLSPQDARVIALATDDPPPPTALPRFHLDDIGAIADFVCRRCGFVEPNRRRA
jgi:molybdopterin-guanine dinucleotide biosynthesis protein B